jgi:hypothetical protein
MQTEMVSAHLYNHVREQRDEALEELRQIKALQNEHEGASFRWNWLRFTPSERVIFEELMRRELVRKEGLLTCLDHLLGGDRSLGIVNVMIFKIRQKLKPHRVDVFVQWGVGYYIRRDEKNRLNALADEQQQAGR